MNALRQHAFEAEEVMAYLDGELDSQRAAALAAHLEHCGECQSISREFRQLSERMLDFSVEPVPQQIGEKIRSAPVQWKPESERKQGRLKSLQGWREILVSRYAIAGAWLVIVALVIGGVTFNDRLFAPPSNRSARRITVDDDVITPLPPDRQAQLSANAAEALQSASANNMAADDLVVGGAASEPAPPVPQTELENRNQPGETTPTAPSVPMIAQTAAVTIVPANYDQASAALAGLATSRGGYVLALTTQAPSDSARQLSETLRVPQQQLAAFMSDLRKLGQVEQESQSNVEVTAEYVDLDARLKNARLTEQRLTALLETRTGKLEDVLDVERELERVRGDIESMQGQENLLLHRVNYATIDVHLEEQYQAKLGTGTSTGTLLANAVVDGFRNLRDGTVGLLVFLFSDGPTIAFWSLLLLVPAWLLWRRLRRANARRQSASVANTLGLDGD
jgi:hypothetical protein